MSTTINLRWGDGYLIVEPIVPDELTKQLKTHYKKIIIGNPLKEDVLVGPIINEEIFLKMQNVLNECNATQVPLGAGVVAWSLSQ